VQARNREALDGIVMALPWIIGFVFFALWPILQSLYYSFNAYDVFNPPVWTGLANYRELFADDVFATSLANTVYYTVISVPLQIVVALLLAFLMTSRIRGVPVFMALYYLPSVIAGVAVSLIWKYLFQSDIGIFNTLLGYVGVGGPPWLDSVLWSKPSLILLSTWQVGTIMIIYIAAIKNIPRDYYDAATIDGAGLLRQFIRITIPLISPLVFFTVVIRLIDSFKIFTEVWALTYDNPMPAGGPARSTLMLVVYIFQNAFSTFRMGYASALSWVLLVIVLVLTLANFRMAKAWVHYD
jgi:multiple sugar transport system permease protein